MAINEQTDEFKDPIAEGRLLPGFELNKEIQVRVYDATDRRPARPLR